MDTKSVMATNYKVRDWQATVDKLYRDIPAAKDVDWSALFRDDPKILGAIINDIIKIAISEKGRPGKRSASNVADIANDLLKLSQLDYAENSFFDSMQIQMKNRSIRQVARNSGLDKMTVRRLYIGEQQPTPYHMEHLAKAFKKNPSYFLEYRALFVCAVLYEMLLTSSDAAVIFYKKIRKNDRWLS